MRKHCLRDDELTKLVEIELGGVRILDDEVVLKKLFEDWYSWDVEFVCLVTILSYVLERKQKKSINALPVLRHLYNLPDLSGLGLVFEQMDENFIAYLLQFTRSSNLSIDDELIEIRNHFGNYDYSFQR